MRPSSSRRARPRCPATRPRAHRRSATATSAYCPARADVLADRVWLQQASPGQSHHEPVETGDRRRVERAHGRAPGDRGGRGRPRAQPHAGLGTPDLRPHRLIANGVGVNAPAPLIHAPRYPGRALRLLRCVAQLPGAERIPWGGSPDMAAMPPAPEPKGPVPEPGSLQRDARALSSARSKDHPPLDDEPGMTRVTLGKSRVQKSRMPGSVRAKPNGLATRPTPDGLPQLYSW